MKTDVLTKAKRLLNARRFPEVIALLEPLLIDYRDSFSFYYTLGTACLYVGDIGGAELYYKKARNLKLTDTALINAQAVLFLRRGDVQKAVEYYLEVQEYDSGEPTAKKALDFIKKNSDAEKLNAAVQTGKIRQFYPPLAMHPAVRILIAAGAAVLCAAFVLFVFVTPFKHTEKRADLSSFVLTVEEKQNALVQDTASSVFKCILTKKELEKAYADAQMYFQKYKDNAAQVEINRILNSNASSAIRQKARFLMDYLKEPGFDTVSDNYGYTAVQSQPWLYMDCWVVWSGRVTNVDSGASEYRCDFLVGYDTMKKMEGIVPLVLKQPVVIDTALPVSVLARIGIENGRLVLKGKSVYQPVRAQ